MNEQQLRHVITQMLITEDQYSGASGRLYKAFIEPFVDVAKGVAIAGQSILNSLKLIFDTLTTISPKKLVKARDNYNKRKNVLDREWEPLLKKARESRHMTQEELGQIIDKKRTYISRVENDGSNITLSTLFDIVEKGLGGKVSISIDV